AATAQHPDLLHPLRPRLRRGHAAAELAVAAQAAPAGAAATPRRPLAGRGPRRPDAGGALRQPRPARRRRGRAVGDRGPRRRAGRGGPRARPPASRRNRARPPPQRPPAVAKLLAAPHEEIPMGGPGFNYSLVLPSRGAGVQSLTLNAFEGATKMGLPAGEPLH